MKLLLTFVIFCSCIVCSCTDNSSSVPVIPEDQFVNLYADLLLLKQEGQLIHADSAQMKKRTDSLYTIYHVNNEQVEAALNRYKRSLKDWKELHEKVIKRLESLQSSQPPHPKKQVNLESNETKKY